MEERLESYRLRKRRQEKIQTIKEKLWKMVSINVFQNNDIASDDTKVKIEVILTACFTHGISLLT